MKVNTKPDSIEVTLDIAAPPDRVWSALTDADELTRWFPPTASVTSGEGGEIRLGWEPELEMSCSIETWTPNKHLRTGWADGVTQEQRETNPIMLYVDYFLEPAGDNATRLRLVHSGFGQGAEWESMYDGIRRGWSCELNSLKHFLERHSNKQRELTMIGQAVSDERAAWDALTGKQGLNFSKRPEDLLTDDSYSFQTPGEGAFTGRVLLASDRDFMGTIAELNDSIFRLGVHSCFGEQQMMIFISAWGVDTGRLGALKDKLNSLLNKLYAGTRV